MERRDIGTSQSDTFTGTGTGQIIPLIKPHKSYALQVKGTGAVPTSWTVTLEGSLDGIEFTTILTHNSNDGSTVWSLAPLYPCLYMRSHCTALSLGSATNIVATTLGMI